MKPSTTPLKVVPDSEHSRLPPSGAERWTTCTASIGFIERNRHLLPEDNSSDYSREGTKAHDLAKEILTGKARLVQSSDPDMLSTVRGYVDFIATQRQDGDRVLVERRTPLFYLPTQSGTVDCGLIGKNRIAIIDLKYGAGVSVYAEENKQLAIYAESLISELEVMDEFSEDLRIDIFIYQPRDRNDPEPVRHWPILRKDLRKFCADIDTKAKAIIADSSKGEFVPSEKACRFCPASGICVARGTQGLSVISDEPVDAVLAKPSLELKAPETLTRQQRLKVIAMRPALEKWLEAVEDQEVHELMTGAVPITHKLVEGKTNRKWTDEEAARNLLIAEGLPPAEVSPPSVVSPAQAEKLLKKFKVAVDFSALVTKPQGKPTLASVDDKRPALEFNANNTFEDLTECI